MRENHRFCNERRRYYPMSNKVIMIIGRSAIIIGGAMTFISGLLDDKIMDLRIAEKVAEILAKGK